MMNGNKSPIEIQTFNYTISRPGFQQKISYDLQIPLPSNSRGADFFGHLLAKQNVPLFAFEEVENAFNNFVLERTNYFTAVLADELLKEKLASCKQNPLKLAAEVFENSAHSQFSNSGSFAEEQQIPFVEQFQGVINECSAQQLLHLIKEEAKMTKEMNSLLESKGCKLADLEKACEENLEISSRDADKFEDCSHQISLLNAEIRKVRADFTGKMDALRQHHRQKYHSLVRMLSQNAKVPLGKINGSVALQIPEEKKAQAVSLSYSPSSSLLSQRSRKEKRNFLLRSVSCEEKISQLCLDDRKKVVAARQSESFSIYIGSQLKSRHNVRLLTCGRLSELCLSQTFEDIPHKNCEKEGEEREELFGSKRLHLLMNLYGRDLSAAVLIVERDPLWHVKQRTEFARLCEQSVELHFDSLEMQLKAVEAQIRLANQGRKAKSESLLLSSSLPTQKDIDENMLQVGDVYLTRHSNLSAVQVVFHLVGDEALSENEISSRHPCVGGLHNIVRLSSRFSIRNISLPLLLVDEFLTSARGGDEKFSSGVSGWCLTRAELVFKCLKGFLMEVCSSGSSCSLSGGASSGPVQTLHFNINFAIPSALASPIFHQLVELFANIYYLVPSLNA